MIDVDGAPLFLLERGLIGVEAIIDGALTIRSVARRNRNLRVEGPGGLGYIVKQPDDPTQGGHYTLRSEAAFYGLCHGGPLGGRLAGIVPRLAYCDPEGAILALELYADAVPLWEHYGSADPSAFPVATARALGRALGTVHAAFRAIGPDDPALAWMPRAVPWILSAHKPGPEVLASISPANYQTLRILQSHEVLGPQLDTWRKCWRIETVIHGDIKSDNVLVLPGAAEVRLVDWELVQVGDPAWDLAGALQDVILFWVNSMPLGAGLTAEQMVASARFPLVTLQAALRALWRGYCHAAEPSPDGAAGLLLRAVAFSSARLIQSAYEYSQSADVLPAQSVLLLQIGANVLADPGLGQAQLYGIPQGLVAR
jgi:hypothetical protein